MARLCVPLFHRRTRLVVQDDDGAGGGDDEDLHVLIVAENSEQVRTHRLPASLRAPARLSHKVSRSLCLGMRSWTAPRGWWRTLCSTPHAPWS